MLQPKKKQSDIKQYKEIDWIEKAMGIVTHPLTAFGYTARNEDIPDNFEKADNTNKFDDIIGMINPARRFKSGVDAMEDIGKGDIKGAALNALGAINPWKVSASTTSQAASRLSRNRKVADAFHYTIGKAPMVDNIIEGVTGKDLASSREIILKEEAANKKKLKK